MTMEIHSSPLLTEQMINLTADRLVERSSRDNPGNMVIGPELFHGLIHDLIYMRETMREMKYRYNVNQTMYHHGRDEITLEDGINKLAKKCHANSREKGFWEKPRNKSEMIGLLHQELSEWLNYLRDGNPPSDKIPDFSGIEEEMADVIIRVLEYAGGFGLNLGGALVAKMAYNAEREYKHGKEF